MLTRLGQTSLEQMGRQRRQNLSDEIRVTVIATGLHSESSQEYDRIPQKMNADYVKPGRDIIETSLISQYWGMGIWQSYVFPKLLKLFWPRIWGAMTNTVLPYKGTHAY